MSAPAVARKKFHRIVADLLPLAVPIESLTLDPRNARLHGSRNLESIRASLAQFGQRKPIVVNEDGTVEAGNGTLESVIALGWTHIAVVRVKDDPATAAAFSIADNRSAELAEWDADRLAELMRSIRADEENDAQSTALLAATGYNEAEIKKLIEGPQNVDGDNFEPIVEHLIVVECQGETAQRTLYERLTAEGFACKIM